MTNDQEPGKLDGILREMRSILDREIRATEEVDAKTELLLGLVIALLGGALALFKDLFGDPAFLLSGPGRVAFVAMWTALALLAAAAALLLHAYIGITGAREPTIVGGPRPSDLLEYARDPDLTRQDLLEGLVEVYPLFADATRRDRQRIMAHRRPALYSLFSGLAAVFVAILIWLWR